MTGAVLKLQSKASLAGDPSLRPVVISIYEAARAAGFAFLFTAAISVFAAGPEECGFCPVISKPSLTTWTPQFAVLREDGAQLQHLVFDKEGHDLW